MSDLALLSALIVAFERRVFLEKVFMFEVFLGGKVVPSCVGGTLAVLEKVVRFEGIEDCGDAVDWSCALDVVFASTKSPLADSFSKRETFLSLDSLAMQEIRCFESILLEVVAAYMVLA